MPRRVNQLGVELIKRFEGLRLKAYKCPANVWTIGYGHTGDVQQGDTITEEQALEMLEDDLQDYAKCVVDNVKVGLNDNQFAALVCFVYNVGCANFKSSTLLKKLNEGVYDAVPAQLMRWSFAGGKPLAGLVNRRKAEAELWQTSWRG